ncbi:MAG TPA: hypothetical protein VD793_00295 [Gemmatimonadales bacterium]|nr:hypothetical protein [Gemmatimonadales bacterium]
MGFRRFVDRDGKGWEIRVRGHAEWEFTPVNGNPGPARSAAAPGYERDPFELSVEELQRLLDDSPPPRGRARPSPFRDDPGV